MHLPAVGPRTSVLPALEADRLIPSGLLHGRRAFLAWTVPRVATGLVVLFAAAVLVAATEGAAHRGELGGDYRVHMAVASQWLDTGRLYADLQLAGPYSDDPSLVYSAGGVVNLYPPPAVLLFVPFLALPPVLWWLTPLAVTAAVLVRWRPASWSWPLLVLPFASVPFASAIIYGNTALWLLAATALATVWPSAALGLALKPTLAPIALLFARRRSWWIAALAAALIGLLLAGYWPEYFTAVTNLRYRDIGWRTVSGLPFVLTPILAKIAATRHPSRPLTGKLATERAYSRVMRRGDPERIYQAQRAGFVEGEASRHQATRERATAVLDSLEAACEALGLERGSPEFWREAERRASDRDGT